VGIAQRVVEVPHSFPKTVRIHMGMTIEVPDCTQPPELLVETPSAEEGEELLGMRRQFPGEEIEPRQEMAAGDDLVLARPEARFVALEETRGHFHAIRVLRPAAAQEIQPTYRGSYSLLREREVIPCEERDECERSAVQHSGTYSVSFGQR